MSLGHWALLEFNVTYSTDFDMNFKSKEIGRRWTLLGPLGAFEVLKMHVLTRIKE